VKVDVDGGAEDERARAILKAKKTDHDVMRETVSASTRLLDGWNEAKAEEESILSSVLGWHESEIRAEEDDDYAPEHDLKGLDLDHWQKKEKGEVERMTDVFERLQEATESLEREEERLSGTRNAPSLIRISAVDSLRHLCC